MRPSSFRNGLRLLSFEGLFALAFVATAPKAPVADAAMRDDITAVRALIAHGAKVNAAQGDGMTALHWAAEHGDSAMTMVLLRAHANVKAVTRIGAYTPLHIASKAGSGGWWMSGRSRVSAEGRAGARPWRSGVSAERRILPRRDWRRSAETPLRGGGRARILYHPN